MSEGRDDAWYLYAVSSIAIDLGWTKGILPSTTVASVQIGGLFVLTSLVPRKLFDRQDPEEMMSNADWLAERVAAHHSVNVAAAGAAPSLPLGFGSLFSNMDRIVAWLMPYEAALAAALNQVSGHSEWQITLAEEACIHAAWLDVNDEALIKLQSCAVHSGEGMSFLLQRRVEKTRAAVRIAHISHIRAKIEQILFKTTTYCLPEPGRIGMPAWTILSDAAQSPIFGKNGELESYALSLVPMGLSMCITGPWPAYAFARAALSKEPEYA